MKIFGLTGKMGSGKDTLADILIVYGFKKYVYSDVIKRELKKRNMEPTRENLQNMGNILRERKGSDVLSKRIYEKIMEEKAEKALVVGIRNQGEVEFFKRLENFKLVWVEANDDVRMKRLIERGSKKDPSTDDMFQRLEEKEKTTGISKLKELADVVIENNGNVSELEEKAREVFGI